MAVKKIPQDDPSSSGEDESESEQPASKPESESESASKDAPPPNVKRKAAVESTVESVKRPKSTENPAWKTPVREDCWSEEATVTLIEEWGRRYEMLKQLQKKDWMEVAEAVNAVLGTERTELQCRNRIDTIKKKYRREKGKPSSSWVLFHRMDSFIRPSNRKPSTAPPSTPASVADDWALLNDLLEGSSLPKGMLTRGLALISEDQKASIAARGKQIFLSELEISGEKNMLISTLEREIFEALKSTE